jgi:hypothetical protein
MRRSLVLLFLLSPLFCLANQQTHSAKPRSLVLTHVMVIDTTGHPPSLT